MTVMQFLFLSIYFVITVLFSYFIAKKIGFVKKKAFIFLISFNLAMNVAGYIFTLLLLFYFHREKKRSDTQKIKILDCKMLSIDFPKIKREYRTGTLRDLLIDKRASEERKVKALSFMKEKIQKEDMKLFFATLSSKSDESRLLAFAKVNGMEKDINDKIDHLIKETEKTKDIKKRAFYNKEIAKLYWEFIYFELVSGSLKDFYLQKAQEFALDSLKAIEDKNELFILLGKIFMEKKEYDKAIKYFKQAISKESDYQNVSPYLAEIYFQKRDFASFFKIIKELKKIKYNQKIAMIGSLWSDYE